jgi:hypothetical protein
LNIEGGTTVVEGPTTIHNTLDVDESTHLNIEGGTTVVEGPTTIHNTLDVDESTHLNIEGGTTVVEGPTTIHNTLDVDESTHLNIEGGTTVVEGPTTIHNTLDVDESTHLNIEGGTTVVEGPTTIHNTLDVDESTHLNINGGTTTIDGITTVTNSTNSSAPTNGALNVDGGVGIEQNLNVAGDTKIDKTLIVRTDGNQGTLNNHVAHFENTSNGNGISVKVGAPTPHNNNNFVTFLNQGGNVVGRIEGENGSADLANNLEYQDELGFFGVDIAMAQSEKTMAQNDLSITQAELGITSSELSMANVNLAITAADLAMSYISEIAAVTSTTACAGLGACATAPIPSLIVASTANLTIAIANVVSAGQNVSTSAQNVTIANSNVNLAQANLALANANSNNIMGNLSTFTNTHQLLIGVTYSSGAGDYAEYIPKLDLLEDFKPGEVLGLKNGKVSRNTLGADRVMVVSFKPAVLGALPEAGKEVDFVKVAFLGQVLTKTFGKVSKGDYILPSGFHNGCAIAKNPNDMLLSDYKKILGVAWSASDSDGINHVNVAVGLNVNDFSGVIQKQQIELEVLKNQMANTNNILVDLVPGFREASNLDTPASPMVQVAKSVDHDDHTGHNHGQEHEFKTQFNTEMVTPAADEIIYYVLTTEDCKRGIDLAKKVMIERGLDLQAHPFWNRLATDPDYEEELIQKMKKETTNSIHYHVEIDKN